MCDSNLIAHRGCIARFGPLRLGHLRFFAQTSPPLRLRLKFLPGFLGNERNTVSKARSRKRELAEFSGKLGEFGEEFGEFAFARKEEAERNSLSSPELCRFRRLSAVFYLFDLFFFFKCRFGRLSAGFALSSACFLKKKRKKMKTKKPEKR